MAYSEQFYKEILDNMPEGIRIFFNNYKEELGYGCYSIDEFVKESIEEKFKNYSRRESLAPIAAKILKSKRDKANYIQLKYGELLNLKKENPKNPLYGFDNKTIKDKEGSYGKGDITYEEALNYKIKECEEWKNSKSLLTEFDGLHFLSKSIKTTSLKIDILLFFWEHVEERYNGNPSSFYVKRILPDIPLIGIKSYKENFPDPVFYVSDSFSKSEPLTILSSEGVTVKIKPSDFLYKSLRSLDPDSIMVLSVIINNINDMGEFSQSRTVKIPISIIRREVFNYNSEYADNKIHSIIEYLSLVKIEYFEKGSIATAAVSVFDKTSYMEVGSNEWVEVRFGEEIAADIVGENIYSVPKREYIKLTNPAAKILCHSIKKEQIRANRETIDLNLFYDYNYFIGKIRFESSNRRDNFKVIVSAFEDYVSCNVMVDSFKVDGLSGIYVTYIPMEIEF